MIPSIISSTSSPTDWVDSPGARLRRIRLDRNMSIVDLSKQSGLSTIAISYIESGQNKASLPTLRTFSIILQTSVASLGCFEKLPDKTFGERILKARLFHGHTKRDAARHFGIDSRTFWNWESNTCVPSKKSLHLINRYLAILTV